MTELAGRLEALRAAVTLADGRLDPAAVEAARAVGQRATERMAAGDEVVVVALAGGTGSGKSSLFNALVGTRLAEVGPTRPVTGEVMAWSVGEPAAATAVLDWLGVRRRYHSEAARLPQGCVLLDLPDHDSVVVEHRDITERFVQRVDVLVWVTDPLKYSQAELHDRQLRRLAEHAEVLVVVLNHADVLGEAQRVEVLADLHRLLAERGLADAAVLVTSARTGEGVDELAATIDRLVTQRRAVAARLSADLRTVVGGLSAGVGDTPAAQLDPEPLVAALATAAGLEPLAASGARSYYEDAARAGSPVLAAALARRVRRLLPRPGPARAVRDRRDDLSPVAVRHALDALVARATDGLPHPWPERLRARGAGLATALGGAVGTALDHVDVHDVRPRRWWPAFRVLGTVFELTALLGAGSLGLLALLAGLGLPEPPTPEVGTLPLPTALLVVGAIALAVTGLVRRRLAAVGAERHRRRVRSRLLRAVTDVVAERVGGPLRGELERHDRLAAALDAVRQRR